MSSNIDFLRVVDNLVYTLDNMNSRYFDNLHSIRNNTPLRRRPSNVWSIPLSTSLSTPLSRPLSRPFSRPLSRPLSRPFSRPFVPFVPFQNIPITTPLRPINRPTNENINSFINNTLYTPSRSNYPTYNEIIRSTTSSIFGDTLNTHEQETCVISRETFTNSTEILRINHCGHIFKKENLLAWFDTSSICPICRHNIRIDLSNNNFTSTTADNADNADNAVDDQIDLSNNSLPNPFSQILDNISNVVINNLTNSVEQVLNTRIDLSNNPVAQFEYTFTMPNSNMTLR